VRESIGCEWMGNMVASHAAMKHGGAIAANTGQWLGGARGRADKFAALVKGISRIASSFLLGRTHLAESGFQPSVYASQVSNACGASTDRTPVGTGASRGTELVADLAMLDHRVYRSAHKISE
jgi:hypothetical protein